MTDEELAELGALFDDDFLPPAPWRVEKKRLWDEEVQYVVGDKDGFPVDLAIEPVSPKAYPSGAFLEVGGYEGALRLMAAAPALLAEVQTLRSELRRCLRDFRMVNESGLWRGHPFTHAVRDIKAALGEE